MNAGQISKLISFNYCFHVEEVVIFLLKLFKGNLLNLNFRQISNFLIYINISTLFVHALSRSSICFPRFSENLPFGAQWSSNKRRNFSETQPTILNRKPSEKCTKNSQNTSFFKCICLANQHPINFHTKQTFFQSCAKGWNKNNNIISLM